MLSLLVTLVCSVQGRDAMLQRPVPTVEAESMKIVSAFGGPAEPQNMASFNGRWSGATQLLWKVQPKFFNSRLVLSFKAPEKGTFTPVLRFTQAPDFGTFALYCGDRRVATIDGWAKSVAPTRVVLPQLTVGDQEVVIKVDSFTHDIRSDTDGLYVGLDCIEFHRIQRSQALEVSGGFCPGGGSHSSTSPSSDSFALDSVPYGMWTFRWCFYCGCLFNRSPNQEIKGLQFVGGSCPVKSPSTWVHSDPPQLQYHHLGNPSSDKVVALASEHANGALFRWCANCKAIYRDDIKPPIGKDGCAYGHDSANRTHVPYKNDSFVIRQTDNSGRYQVCSQCGVLFSLKDYYEQIFENNFAIKSGCAASLPLEEPHKPVPNVYYDLKLSANSWTDPMWAKCVKCKALFCMRDLPGNSGVCAAGSTHVPDTHSMYRLPHHTAPNTPKWFECVKCASLFFGGDSATAGKCIAGGQHALKTPYKPGEQNQTMVTKTLKDGEAGWHVCDKCGLLFSQR